MLTTWPINRCMRFPRLPSERTRRGESLSVRIDLYWLMLLIVIVAKNGYDDPWSVLVDIGMWWLVMLNIGFVRDPTSKQSSRIICANAALQMSSSSQRYSKLSLGTPFASDHYRVCSNHPKTSHWSVPMAAWQVVETVSFPQFLGGREEPPFPKKAPESCSPKAEWCTVWE